MVLDTIVAGLRSGRTKVIGSGDNRLPITSVTDAAAALVHLAGLPRAELVARSFLAVPPAPATQRAFLDATTDAPRYRRPGAVPAVLAALLAGRISADCCRSPRALESDGVSIRSRRRSCPS